MDSQSWRQVDNFVTLDEPRCICTSKLAEPECPVHGFPKKLVRRAGVDYGVGESEGFIDGIPISEVSILLRNHMKLKFAVMGLIAQTLDRVPSTALGWDNGRLDEINELCK